MRTPALLRYLPIGLFAFAVSVSGADLHTLLGFEAAFRAAHSSHSVRAVEDLICWDRVPPQQRREWRVSVRREFAYHIDELIITPPNRFSAEPRRVHDRVYRPNLPVSHTMAVTFALNDPGVTANLPIGRKEGRFYIASFVPSTR